MTASQIDEAILSTVSQRWMKVAMVIVKVEKVVRGELPQGYEGLELISSRIEQLVGSGSLASHGDLQNWRLSEVRRAGNDPESGSAKTTLEKGNIK